MTETPMTQSSAPPHTPTERTGWAGWAVFAGVMLVLVGAFQAIDGLVALFKDEIYVVRPNGLVVNVDYTAWGWVHLHPRHRADRRRGGDLLRPRSGAGRSA